MPCTYILYILPQVYFLPLYLSTSSYVHFHFLEEPVLYMSSRLCELSQSKWALEVSGLPAHLLGAVSPQAMCYFPRDHLLRNN